MMGSWASDNLSNSNRTTLTSNSASEKELSSHTHSNEEFSSVDTEEVIADLKLEVKHWKEELKRLNEENLKLKQMLTKMENETQRLNLKVSNRFGKRLSRAISEIFLGKKFHKSKSNLSSNTNESGSTHILHNTNESGSSHMLHKANKSGPTHILHKTNKSGPTHILHKANESGSTHILKKTNESCSNPIPKKRVSLTSRSMKSSTAFPNYTDRNENTNIKISRKLQKYENDKSRLTDEQIHHLAYNAIMVYKWEYKFPLEFGSSVMEVISDIQNKDPIWAACRMMYRWIEKNPTTNYLTQLSFIKHVFKKLFTKDIAHQIVSKLVTL